MSAVFDHLKPDLHLLQAYSKLREDYSELCKQELGCPQWFRVRNCFQIGGRASFLQNTVCAVRDLRGSHSRIWNGVSKRCLDTSKFNGCGTSEKLSCEFVVIARWLLVTSRGTSSSFATPRRYDEQIGWWLWFYETWSYRCLCCTPWATGLKMWMRKNVLFEVRLLSCFVVDFVLWAFYLHIL